jgi:hypothetical protein
MTHKAEKTPGPSVIAVDRNYVPMMEVARRKAIRAVASGRAMVLDPRSLDRHENLRGTLVLIIFPHAQACTESRLLMGRLDRRVMRRDHYTCQYEGCSNRADTIDHIIPVCQGGRATWQNLVACCLVCNQTKGGRTPDQAGMRLKKVPEGPRAHLFRRFEEILKEGSAA